MNVRSGTRTATCCLRVLLTAVLLLGIAPAGRALPRGVAAPLFEDHVAPEQVALSGPTTGGLNEAYSFTATVAPETASLPITYTWQATGLEPVVHADVPSLSDTASFAWASAGVEITGVAETVWPEEWRAAGYAGFVAP